MGKYDKSCFGGCGGGGSVFVPWSIASTPKRRRGPAKSKTMAKKHPSKAKPSKQRSRNVVVTQPEGTRTVSFTQERKGKTGKTVDLLIAWTGNGAASRLLDEELIDRVTQNMDGICRKSLDEEVLQNMVETSPVFMVAVDPNTAHPIAMLGIANPETYKECTRETHPADAWYLDIICSKKGYQGLASFMLRKLYELARQNGRTEIQLYATYATKEYWKGKGFQERDETRRQQTGIADRDIQYFMQKSI